MLAYFYYRAAATDAVGVKYIKVWVRKSSASSRGSDLRPAMAGFENFTHVNDLQQEWQSDLVVVFWIIRIHHLIFYTERVFPIVQNDGYSRDVLLVAEHFNIDSGWSP